MSKDEKGHLGVAAGLNADHSANAANWGAPIPWWWSADPLAKVNTAIYDDRYTFSDWDADAGKGKFSFNVGPDGAIFGKEEPMKADLGGDKELQARVIQIMNMNFIHMKTMKLSSLLFLSQQDGTGIKMVSMKILLLVKKSILEKK